MKRNGEHAGESVHAAPNAVLKTKLDQPQPTSLNG